MSTRLSVLALIASTTSTLALAQGNSNPPLPENPTPPATDSSLASTSAEIAELKRQVEALTKTVESLQDQLKQKSNLSSGFNSPSYKAVSPVEAPDSSSLADLRADLEELKQNQRQTRSGLFNPDISAATDFITSYSARANNWNFTLRDVELQIAANIDQYVRGYIVFNAETELDPTERLSPFEDAELGLEEAAIVTNNLPWGLQVKAGQFFADFTRLGKVHSHDLPFVDRPHSLDSIIGGEAKARGLELTWVPPTSHYFRLSAGLVDNIGAEEPLTSRLSQLDGNEVQAFTDRVNRPFQSLFAYGRLATQFEFGANTVLRLGADYGQSSQRIKRDIASADFKIEWRPNPASFDLFEAGGEILQTRQHGRLSDDAFIDRTNPFGDSKAYGGYLYAQYRFGKSLQPGIRADYTHGENFALGDRDLDGEPDTLEKNRESLWTYSAYLTLYASEFNRLRFQLSYLDSNRNTIAGKSDDDWQAFLQWTVIFGAHKHDFAP